MSNTRKTRTQALIDFDKVRCANVQMIAAVAEAVDKAAPLLGPDRTQELLGRILVSLNKVFESKPQ